MYVYFMINTHNFEFHSKATMLPHPGQPCHVFPGPIDEYVATHSPKTDYLAPFRTRHNHCCWFFALEKSQKLLVHLPTAILVFAWGCSWCLFGCVFRRAFLWKYNLWRALTFQNLDLVPSPGLRKSIDFPSAKQQELSLNTVKNGVQYMYLPRA